MINHRTFHDRSVGQWAKELIRFVLVNITEVVLGRHNLTATTLESLSDKCCDLFSLHAHRLDRRVHLGGIKLPQVRVGVRPRIVFSTIGVRTGHLMNEMRNEREGLGIRIDMWVNKSSYSTHHMHMIRFGIASWLVEFVRRDFHDGGQVTVVGTIGVYR